MTFDLDLWPTDKTIHGDHLLIKDYLPTKFEASGAKRCWVIRCTRFERLTWPLTLTFDLTINRNHLLIKDYLPTKFEACGSKRSWVIRCTRFERLTWPWPLTYWPDYQYGSSTHQGLSTYQVWSLWGKAFLRYSLHKVWETDMTFDLDLWPTDLTINTDHLLIKDYLPTKFEACGAKCSWVISCTRLRATDIPTDRHTDIPTNMCNAICPSFFEGGHKYAAPKTMI